MSSIANPVTEGWAWEPELSGWGLRNTGTCKEKSPVCMSVWTSFPVGGGIEVEASSPWISVADLMNRFLASDIIFDSFEFLGYSNLFVGTNAATGLRVYAKKGTTETLPVDVTVNYAGDWSKVIASVNLVLASGGVAQYDMVKIKLYHFLNIAAEQSVLAFGGAPQMNLLVTTQANVNPVRFKVVNAETGFAIPNCTFIVENTTRVSGTTSTDGTATINVYDGSYTVTARTMIEGKWYSGATTFTAPTTEVVVFIEAEGILPWWWWVPIAAGGGLIGLWLITRMFKRAPSPPPIYVVK